MRVLQVINSLRTGGAERLLAESIPFYQTKVKKMDILVLDSTKTEFYSFLKKNSNSTLFYNSYLGVYNILQIFRIIPYLFKYDIIHVHLFPSLYWVVFAKIISFSKVKLVYTEHSTYNKRRNHRFLSKIDKIVYSKIDAIVSITESVQKNLIDHLRFKSSAKFRVISNGVNLQRFFPILDTRITKKGQSKNFTIIQVSSFSPQKDQNTLIQSLNYLPEWVNVILVGKGKLKNECEELVRNLDLTERVSFLGVRSDIPELINSADLVVLSSIWEGFGLAAVEGMACGKPVIASDVPGLSDVVRNYGILFNPSDSKDLSSKIQKFIYDRDFYEKIRRKCIERADSYKIENMVNEYFKVYKSLIKN